MTRTATFVKQNDDMRSDARMYRLDPPLDKKSQVLVSAASISDSTETYIFPCDDDGNVTSWVEMRGSQKDTLSHAKVLSDLGYTVLGGDDIPLKPSVPLDEGSAAFVAVVDLIADLVGCKPGTEFGDE